MKKKLISIVAAVLIVGGVIATSVYSVDRKKINRTASNLTKMIDSCDALSNSEAFSHNPANVATYKSAIDTAMRESEKPSTQKELDKITKDLEIADAVFRSDKESAPVSTPIVPTAITNDDKPKIGSDKDRTEAINQMKARLNNSDFDGANASISNPDLFNDDEIKTIKVYIEGKQEYVKEIQDDANHPEYKAPNSLNNYIGVQVNLGYIDPQYKGIYANEIKDYVHKFMNDDEWTKQHSDVIERAAKIQSKMNALEPTIGMTANEVGSSNWGNPSSKNKTTNTYGTSEQWVYPGNKYIYLDNGIVTSIQSH